MKHFLTKIPGILRGVYQGAQFSNADLMAILQAITGFASAFAGKDPFQALDTALGVAAHFATKCNTGSFNEVKGKVKKWLTFGKEYSALENSNDLDFDKMDIASIPEVMKVKAKCET